VDAVLTRVSILPGFESLVLKETNELCNAFQYSTGEAFQSLLDDLGFGFINYEYFPSVACFLVPVPWRIGENPESLFEPCLHFLADLSSIRLPLIGCLSSNDGLNEFSLGAFLEVEVRTQDLDVSRSEFFSQSEMHFYISGKPFEVIKDENVFFLWVLIYMSNDCVHRWTIK
jgi:hypothetical protein